jgi:hypothetical protein
MYKFFERLIEFVENSTFWLVSIFVLILIKRPIEILFCKIGFWLSKGFNADVVSKILESFQGKIEVKFEKRFLSIEKKQQKILKDVQHSKNNIKLVRDLLESIKKDDEKILNKLNKNVKSCKNYEEI